MSSCGWSEGARDVCLRILVLLGVLVYKVIYPTYETFPLLAKNPPLYTMILEIKISTVGSHKDPKNRSLLHALLRY